MASKHKYTTLPSKDYDDDEAEIFGKKSNRGLVFDNKFKEQDDHLDKLSTSVSRLGQISLDISREIDMQNRMIDGLQSDVEEATGRTDALTKKTKELIQKSGGMKVVTTIIILVIILIILTLLVIYT